MTDDSPADIYTRRRIAETEYFGVLPPLKTCADGAHRMRRSTRTATWHCVYCGAPKSGHDARPIG